MIDLQYVRKEKSRNSDIYGFFVVDFGYNFILGIEISDSFRSLNKFNRISHIQTKTDVFELHFPMRFFLFKDVDFGGLIILAFPIISQ